MARPKKAENDLVKASAAIQINGKITLLQRRAWNVLLAHAYDELPNKDRHSIHVVDLIRILEFNSDRDEYLKDALRALTSCNVEWNILDKDGETEWGVAALLAGARITRGICTYTYEPMLREKLHNPRIYARLCLSLQNKFESKYALTLWELCTDYLGSKRDYGETPWIKIDDFRNLMGIGKNEYRAFRDVNKRIICQPIAEINRLSDFRVTVDYQHTGRKVTALKFKMRRVVLLPEPENTQAKLFPEMEDMPVIVRELKDAGVGTQDAWEIWQQGFDYVNEGTRLAGPSEDAEVAFLHYIREKIHLLKRRQASGKVENSTGFLLEAIRQNYANPEFEQEQQRKAAAEEQQTRKKKEKDLKILREKIEETGHNEDAALATLSDRIIDTQPVLLEEAIATIRQEKNAAFLYCYDGNKSPLENYRHHRFVADAVATWLEGRFPEQYEETKAPFRCQRAEIEARITALENAGMKALA